MKKRAEIYKVLWSIYVTFFFIQIFIQLFVLNNVFGIYTSTNTWFYTKILITNMIIYLISYFIQKMVEESIKYKKDEIGIRLDISVNLKSYIIYNLALIGSLIYTTIMLKLQKESIQILNIIIADIIIFTVITIAFNIVCYLLKISIYARDIKKIKFMHKIKAIEKYHNKVPKIKKIKNNSNEEQQTDNKEFIYPKEIEDKLKEYYIGPKLKGNLIDNFILRNKEIFGLETKESKIIDNYKIILFEDTTSSITSSLNMTYEENKKTAKNIIYLDCKKELPIIEKKYPYAYNKIINNLAGFIKCNDLKNYTFEQFMLDTKKYNKMHNYMFLINSNVKEIPSKYKALLYARLIKAEHYAEEIEQLLENKYIPNYNLIHTEEPSYKTNMQNYLCSKYDKRFFYTENCYPKSEYLKTLYKSAFTQDSIYQSLLILLNYINVLHQIVTYYIYLKNTQDDKINKNIIKDNFDSFAINLKNNLKPEDLIYDNIKSREYVLDYDMVILTKKILANIIDNEFEGNKLTYYGGVEVLNQVRNKIQAHGNIGEENIYYYWYLVYKLANLFNKIFEVDKLTLEYKEDNIYVSYDNESQCMYDYLVNKDNLNLYVAQSSNNEKNLCDYIDYLDGNYIKPSVKK